jgi:hypothetical protein
VTTRFARFLESSLFIIIESNLLKKQWCGFVHLDLLYTMRKKNLSVYQALMIDGSAQHFCQDICITPLFDFPHWFFFSFDFTLLFTNNQSFSLSRLFTLVSMYEYVLLTFSFLPFLVCFSFFFSSSFVHDSMSDASSCALITNE